MNAEYYSVLQNELKAIEKRAWSVLRQQYSDDVIKGALGGWDELNTIIPSDSAYTPQKYALMLLDCINDVWQSVAKQSSIDAKLAVLEAARAGFDVGLNYLGMNDKRIGKIVDNFKSKQTSEASKIRHEPKRAAKKRANELAEEHWKDPTKKNRHSLSATSSDIFKKLQEEGVWHKDYGWGKNAVNGWIKDNPNRPPQKAGRKPKPPL